MISFLNWIKLKEDFHQGPGTLGATTPLKNDKRKDKAKLMSNLTLRIEKGQGIQGTRRDDGNG